MLRWRIHHSVDVPRFSHPRLRNHSTLAPSGQLLRRVAPYWARSSAKVKDRWLGRRLSDVWLAEFSRKADYLEWALASGLTLVNGKLTTPSTILSQGDWIASYVHRHEPPVIAEPPRILHLDPAKHFAVIHKPASLPVHPTGPYHHNTLTRVLARDLGLGEVYTVNRLDSPTSGVMLVALDAETARRVSMEMERTSVEESGTIRKEYLAKVHGAFPEDEIVVDQPILLAVNRPYGVAVVHPEGRTARTVFKLLRYSPTSDTSLVLCRPITGRTHQIRVHLQFIGYPIVGDVMYGDECVWGPTRGKGGIPHAIDPDMPLGYANGIQGLSAMPLSSALVEVIRRIRARQDSDTHNTRARDVHLRSRAPLSPDALRAMGLALPEHEGQSLSLSDLTAVVAALPDPAITTSPWRDASATDHEYCPTCFLPTAPDPRRMAICLHAWRYSSTSLGLREGVVGGGVSEGGVAEGVFEAPIPGWAEEMM